jgi:phospholipid/cholesterol/gamma-HCH transport system permease protein
MPEPDANAAPAAAAAQWQRDGGQWCLNLRGDVRSLAADWARLPPADGAASLSFDGRGLLAWDAATAARLWALEREARTQERVVRHQGLPEGLAALLALAGNDAGDDKRQRPAAVAEAPQGGDFGGTLAFLGAVLIAIARWLRGRAAVRAADVIEQLDHSGPRSLPIVVLCCALVGLMLAYMGGAQLGRIGAQGFLADVVTVGMLRELAGLMAGVMLAGRIGAAFAAQLGTMQAGEEIDALRVLGVDPVAHLVLPRLLALLAMAPALYAFGALAGVVAGWPAATLAYGVTSAEYWAQAGRAVSATHLLIGLFKCMVYVALVALAGCHEGLAAGRGATAVGAATTAAVVKGLVWIVTAACATTVVFTALGY